LPSRGFTTTDGPNRANAPAASAAVRATVPAGTGTPAPASSSLATIVSHAMSTPTADVCSVSAARTSRRWQPYPSRSMLRLPTRRTGMSRPRAAAASAAVLTPRRDSSTDCEITRTGASSRGIRSATMSPTRRMARVSSSRRIGESAGSSRGQAITTL
jgi:hypothetical protein